MGASGSPRDASDARCRRAVLALLGCLVLALSLSAAPVRAQPPVPMLVHGHAYDVSGVPLPAGTPVRALVDGVVYSNATQVSDATGAYSILIAGNWMQNGTVSETPTIKEGADLGDVVTFAAGDFTNATRVFQETVAWSPSGVVSLDLHLGAAGSQPDELKLQTVVTRPARIASPYVILCNPGPSDVLVSDYYLQTDIPGSYDGPRFNLTGTIAAGGQLQVNVSTPGWFNVTGDALKLVFHNPGGSASAAGGRDIPADRVEFNATAGGTLDWEPGSTTMGSAPAPGPGAMLTRSPACADTNTPQDFVLQREPGLPANSTVSVSLVVPTNGQVVAGGQSLTMRWTIGSNTFTTPAYLRVWVNVSYAGKWVPLVQGAYGVESVAWDVPNVAEPAASVNVTVVDPFGARASQTVSFVIQLQSPWPVALAILVAVVVAVFLFLGYRSLRRSRAQPPSPAPTDELEPAPAAAPSPAPPATPTAALAGATTKVCPECGTQVKVEDDSCFFCGHLFVSPPPP